MVEARLILLAVFVPMQAAPAHFPLSFVGEQPEKALPQRETQKRRSCEIGGRVVG